MNDKPKNKKKVILFVEIIIVALILISIIRIFYLMYIGANRATIVDNPIPMSIQGIEVHNSQFTIFEGNQTGGKVRTMLGTILANANTYKDEPSMIPEVKIVLDEEKYISRPSSEDLEQYNDELEKYKDEIKELKDTLDQDQKYKVDFTYTNVEGRDDDLIDCIYIMKVK